MAKVDTIKILIEMTDGSVSIMSFVTKQYASIDGPSWEREVTATEIEKEIEKTFVNRDVKPNSWKIVNEDIIPIDRTFRNAWYHTKDGKIDHDMTKACEIHKNRLRNARTSLLNDLDVAYLKADEKDDVVEKNKIIKEKQRLRDITADPKIESATTVEELRLITI